MNVTFEKTSDLEGIIKVEVTPADYADQVKKEIKKLGANRSLPGFRKGQTPYKMLEKMFGMSVKSDILNHIVGDELFNYLKSSDLNVLGQPIPMSNEEITMEEKDYTFSFEVGLAPKMDFPIDENVEMPYYTVEVDDQMRAQLDEDLRKQMAQSVPASEIDDTAVVSGAVAQLNEDGTLDKNEGAVENMETIFGMFVISDEEFKNSLIGKKVDETFTFKPSQLCKSEGDIASFLKVDKEKAAEVADKPFEFTITRIISSKPCEKNQAFFDNAFGAGKVTNDQEYNAELTKILQQQYVGLSNQLFRFQIDEYIMETIKPTPLPEDFLMKTFIANNKDKKAEEIEADKEQAFNQVRWMLADEYIRTKYNVEVNEEELKEGAKQALINHFQRQGAYMPFNPEMLDSYADEVLKNEDSRRAIYKEVYTGKFYEALKNHVTLNVQTASRDKMLEIQKQYIDKYKGDIEVAEATENEMADEAADAAEK